MNSYTDAERLVHWADDSFGGNVLLMSAVAAAGMTGGVVVREALESVLPDLVAKQKLQDQVKYSQEQIDIHQDGVGLLSMFSVNSDRFETRIAELEEDIQHAKEQYPSGLGYEAQSMASIAAVPIIGIVAVGFGLRAMRRIRQSYQRKDRMNADETALIVDDRLSEVIIKSSARVDSRLPYPARIAAGTRKKTMIEVYRRAHKKINSKE